MPSGRMPRYRHESFSTLHAGRVAATKSSETRSRLDFALSVPSMRVESLQHPLLRAALPNAPRFQYPPCGSSRCNHQLKSGEQQKAQVFQYPPCGSSRCNAFWRAHIVGEDESFSTLHAGRVAATSLEPWRGILATTLSVPSMRVESLQRSVISHARRF